MSNFAHIPYAIVIVLIAALLGFLGTPASAIGVVGAFLFLFTREEAQREYQIIEKLNPPLRSGLKVIDAFKFWQWNSHSIWETLIALAAAAAAGLALHLIVLDAAGISL